ncbi:MAG: hypothetical protein PHF25_06425 [Candidatus Margulisbacteria bacterium]|nr:hypothetical protein [Candidatus Margulisiibacteriota bacterium]
MAKKIKNRILPIIVSAIVFLLFIFSVSVLIDKLKGISFADVIVSLNAIDNTKILLAFVLMFFSYTVFTCYDLLAVAYLGYSVKFRKIFMGSFISYVISENIGFALVSGSTIRYKYYSEWGISPIHIAKAITFCTITFWLGMFTVAGVFLTLHPIVLPDSSIFSNLLLLRGQLLGPLMLGIVLFYFFVGVLRKTPLKIRGSQYIVPSNRLAILQLLVGITDFILGSALFYTLLPGSDALVFSQFISIFMFVKIIVIFSNIPAGLGVFETLMLMLLAPYYADISILGTIVIYRVIYYIIPLGFALFIYGYNEFKTGHRRIKAFQRLMRFRKKKLS